MDHPHTTPRPIRWPAIIQYAGQAELAHVRDQAQWDADRHLYAFHYQPADRLIDAEGAVWRLSKRNEGSIAPEWRGETVSLDEVIDLVRGHASQLGECCVAKFSAASIEQAIHAVATDAPPIADQARFARAIAHFDALNAQDPNRELVDGKDYPKELLYADRMSAMLKRYAVNPSEALQLAARTQHIQRWKIDRTSYPMTRTGYHQWRTQLRDFHAETAETVLREAGYDDAMIGRVRSLIKKQGLHTDAEVQTLEDVVVLVFLESYLERFVEEHGDYDEAKFVDILRKTLRKMSQQARLAILTLINPPAAIVPILKQLIAQEENAIQAGT